MVTRKTKKRHSFGEYVLAAIVLLFVVGIPLILIACIVKLVRFVLFVL